MVTILFFVDVPENVSGQVTQEWVVRYDGNLDTQYIVSAMDVDSQGNVFVTGRYPDPVTATDYVTVAYDTDGNELWVSSYDGLTSNDDVPYDIVVDENSGNVYVTGYSRVSNYRFEIDTVAYNSTGSELWAKSYHGILDDYGFDIGKAIALDNSGNVIVVGRTYDSGEHDFDYITLKYTPTGDLSWSAKYDGSAGLFDRAWAVTSDSEDNVYVTGVSDTLYFHDSETPDVDPAYITIKYDSSGTELWTARYDGPGGDLDDARDIIFDSSGKIYVTGLSVGSGTEEDYATVAYDTDGNELWVSRYDGSASGFDNAHNMAMDNLGNIYVVGKSQRSQYNFDLTVVGYDSTGSELWVTNYNGPQNKNDTGYAIAVDILGDIYVTGLTAGSFNDHDYVTIKYDSSGSEQWVKTYNGLGNYWDRGLDIDVDSQLNVYVTGESVGLGNLSPMQRLDYTTIKYSQDYSSSPPAAMAGLDQIVVREATVDFDGSDSFDFNGSIVSYDWDFGDGTTHATGSQPAHVYTTSGTYDVILTVTDTSGMQGSDRCIINVESPTLDLDMGWNLISLPTIQTKTQISDVLASIDGDYSAVNWYDASDPSDPWKHFLSDKPPSMNDLSDLDHTKGLMIKIDAPSGTSLELGGYNPPSSQSISLYPGWNMVGYPSLTEYTRADGLNNLDFGVHINGIQRYDAAKQKWGDMGPSDSFKIGEGYWIYATGNCVWDVPL
jgi:hypothetical protein